MWYYAHGGERVGPVDQAALNAAISNGIIDDTTLVWRDGMTDWRPWGEVRSQASPGTELCAECGQRFPIGEMVAFQNQHICAACKPVYFQRVKETGGAATVFTYAGFWIRFVAKFVDGIIAGIIGMLWQFTLGLLLPQEDPTAFGPLFILSTLGGFLFGIAYYVYFVGKFGATPGKMALGLRIVRADGSSLTYGRATGRFFADYLSNLILFIGYIMAAFDDEKRTLHDRICDTRVVKVN
jgi:uncharacterized RDD family membrane protein YckC